MKRPSIASQKKVTPENLARLGAERLAVVLTQIADSRPELKRQLRMELAARHGAEHLIPEIDKRLASLAASRARVSWRQRPAFLRDLDSLRRVIADQLATHDRAAAIERILAFLDLASTTSGRLRDRNDELDAVFARAATDLGVLLQGGGVAAQTLSEAIARAPSRWSAWVRTVFSTAPASLTREVLGQVAGRRETGWPSVIRQLADITGDIDAYRATFTADALHTPAIAADVATRLMDGSRLEEAGEILKAAAPVKRRFAGGRTVEPDVNWESAWIRYLDRAGRPDEAQAVRWASFQRTLSVTACGSSPASFQGSMTSRPRSGRSTMQPPALISSAPSPSSCAACPPPRRGLDHGESGRGWAHDEDAALWADRLALRWPAAANILLRKSAARAFRQRDYAASARLTEHADAVEP